jgi:dTDP-4-dehydrorhamnose 3,5-epimerase
MVVDLRKNHLLLKQHFSVVLSAENKSKLMVPHGFAHGFSVLSATASVIYKVDHCITKRAKEGLI